MPNSAMFGRNSKRRELFTSTAPLELVVSPDVVTVTLDDDIDCNELAVVSPDAVDDVDS